uniref:Uncharacterized protein n=1 Tax=Solanum lycopersicum TaxID=4081 RepID=A0A3Q7HUA5_SOLLC
MGSRGRLTAGETYYKYRADSKRRAEMNWHSYNSKSSLLDKKTKNTMQGKKGKDLINSKRKQKTSYEPSTMNRKQD